MALLNRPLTKDEIEKLLAATPYALFHSNIFDAIYEARFNVVSYCATANHTQYQTPEVFYWTTADTSPSDCVWMVPGTVREWWQR